MIKDIANKKLKDLTRKQKNILRRVKVSAWDIIMAASGGHRSITNLANLNFLGKGYPDNYLKPIMQDIARELQKYDLVDAEE